MANPTIYQIKLTLKHSKPPIWRRLLISGDTTLPQLHDIIQAAMPWWDYHLHDFKVGDVTYTDPQFELDWALDEAEYTLNEVAPSKSTKIDYMYDFGDGWEHTILVEKILPADPSQSLPVCVKGKRACPPEDVGGVWGYAFFLEALADPEHPEHDHYVEWIGDDFDPEEFNLDEVNAGLENLAKRFRLR